MQGCSADTFWCRVVERLQAAPTGLVTARLADAVRGGLEGEGQAEAPAQVACNCCGMSLQQRHLLLHPCFI